MWQSLFLGLGMITFIVYGYVAKLSKFKGGKLKTRMNYSLGLSLFFTLFLLWQTNGKMEVIGKSILLGAVLSIPLYSYSKQWIEKRIRGATIFYERNQYSRNVKNGLLWAIPCIILVSILSCTGFWEQILEVKIFSGLVLCFSWFIAQAFILFYIVKLEKRLDKPIFENER